MGFAFPGHVDTSLGVSLVVGVGLAAAVAYLVRCCFTVRLRLAWMEAGVFRPEFYGAVGDGMADDTAAFIAACSAMASFGSGSTLLGKAGATYVLYPDSWQNGAAASSLVALGSFSGLSHVAVDFSRSTLRVPRSIPQASPDPTKEDWWGMFRFSGCSWGTMLGQLPGA